MKRSHPPVARIVVSALLGLAGRSIGDAAAPDWIEQAMRQPVPAAFAKADAVILSREIEYNYENRGRVRENVRHVVRVTTANGRTAATLSIPYNRRSDRVRGLEIWIVPEKGSPVHLRENDCIDGEIGQGELYSEYRMVAHSAEEEARPGTVYAYSYSVDRRSIFAENDFVFNFTVPVLHSRLEVAVPAKWMVRSHTNNERVPLQQTTTARRWRWTATNVPAVKDEEWETSPARLRTILHFAVAPASDDAQAYPLLSWSDWSGVASYIEDLSRPAAQPDDDVRAKAHALTADATTDAERIRAIGRYVQDINYVSLSLDLGQGGGYQPHTAGETLRSHYGDCKDKANLMRSLLGVVGVRAFPVVALLSDDSEVDPDWPSPTQFNHCIIGIAVDDASALEPSVIHPTLGSILLFDPTDEITRFGQLSYTLQGSRALIAVKAQEPLIEIPLTQPEQNRTERRIEATLTGAGDVSGRIETRFTGLAANPWRALRRHRSETDFRQTIASRMCQSLRDARISDLQVTDSAGAEELELSLRFDAQGYARSMRGRLLVFQPAMVTRSNWVPPVDAGRETSVSFPSEQLVETVVVNLPSGFTVDELPRPVAIEKPYATYRSTTTVAGSELTFQREVTWRPVSIPASDYEDLRGFFRAMLEADSSALVLVREQ